MRAGEATSFRAMLCRAGGCGSAVLTVARVHKSVGERYLRPYRVARPAQGELRDDPGLASYDNSFIPEMIFAEVAHMRLCGR